MKTIATVAFRSSQRCGATMRPQYSGFWQGSSSSSSFRFLCLQNQERFSTSSSSPGGDHDGRKEEDDNFYDDYDKTQSYFPTDDDSNEDDESDNYPWKTLLEPPARASWRVTPHTTYSSNDGKSAGPHRWKTLQPVFRDMIDTHKKQAAYREAERWRAIRPGKKWQPDNERSAAPILLYGRDEAWAAMRTRFDANRAVTTRVLREAWALLRNKNTNAAPRRVLDMGVGTGGAQAALMDVHGKSVEWIHGVEPSMTMQEAFEYVLEEEKWESRSSTEEKDADGNEEPVPATTPPRRTHAAYLSAGEGAGTFDMTLCAYTLSELKNSTAILAAAALMFEKLAPGGTAVFIEPGTPDGFATMRTVRNLLLDASKADKDYHCRIVAPCTHQGPCPMERFRYKWPSRSEQEETGLKKGYCSFVQSIPPRGGRTRSEKFSYLVVQKVSKSVEGQEDPVGLRDVLTKALRHKDVSRQGAKLVGEATELKDQYLALDNEEDLGLEFVRSDVSSYGRIIHAPTKKKGHVFIECCVEPGRISRYKVSKSMSQTVPGVYAAARKSRWGGFWPTVSEMEG